MANTDSSALRPDAPAFTPASMQTTANETGSCPPENLPSLDTSEVLQRKEGDQKENTGVLPVQKTELTKSGSHTSAKLNPHAAEFVPTFSKVDIPPPTTTASSPRSHRGPPNEPWRKQRPQFPYKHSSVDNTTRKGHGGQHDNRGVAAEEDQHSGASHAPPKGPTHTGRPRPPNQQYYVGQPAETMQEVARQTPHGVRPIDAAERSTRPLGPPVAPLWPHIPRPATMRVPSVRLDERPPTPNDGEWQLGNEGGVGPGVPPPQQFCVTLCPPGVPYQPPVGVFRAPPGMFPVASFPQQFAVAQYAGIPAAMPPHIRPVSTIPPEAPHETQALPPSAGSAAQSSEGSQRPRRGSLDQTLQHGPIVDGRLPAELITDPPTMVYPGVRIIPTAPNAHLPPLMPSYSQECPSRPPPPSEDHVSDEAARSELPTGPPERLVYFQQFPGFPPGMAPVAGPPRVLVSHPQHVPHVVDGGGGLMSFVAVHPMQGGRPPPEAAPPPADEKPADTVQNIDGLPHEPAATENTPYNIGEVSNGDESEDQKAEHETSECHTSPSSAKVKTSHFPEFRLDVGEKLEVLQGRLRSRRLTNEPIFYVGKSTGEQDGIRVVEKRDRAYAFPPELCLTAVQLADESAEELVLTAEDHLQRASSDRTNVSTGGKGEGPPMEEESATLTVLQLLSYMCCGARGGRSSRKLDLPCCQNRSIMGTQHSMDSFGSHTRTNSMLESTHSPMLSRTTSMAGRPSIESIWSRSRQSLADMGDFTPTRTASRKHQDGKKQQKQKFGQGGPKRRKQDAVHATDSGDWGRLPTPEPLPQASEKSWKVQQKHTKDDNAAVRHRKLRASLNKATRENMSELYVKITGILQDITDLNVLIGLLFELAIHQHKNIPMYVLVAHALRKDIRANNLLAEQLSQEEIEKPQETERKRADHFKTQLVNHCQEAFDTLVAKPFQPDTSLDKDEQLEEMMMYKEKMIGTVRFTAALSHLRIVPLKIARQVITKLRQHYVQYKEEEHATMYLDCLANFIMDLGNASVKNKGDNATWYIGEMKSLREYIEDPKNNVGKRERIIFQDCWECIDSSWRDFMPPPTEWPTEWKKTDASNVRQAQNDRVEGTPRPPGYRS